MEDFIFGTLATGELRLAHIRSLRAGVTHRQRREPRDPLPDQPVRLELTAGPDHPCDRAWVYWTNDGSDPAGACGVASNGFVTPLRPAGVEWDTLLWGYVRRFAAVLPGQPAGTLLRYRLTVGNVAGEEIYADGGAYYACFIADDPAPDWAQDAVIYQIFVDRFFPGQGGEWRRPAAPSGFYGGTLNGITEKLDYLAELGVNVLWLTPVFPSPSHHGYDATDYLEIEPRLGSKADMRRLLDAAHARGLRVLLDFVPNHWSSQHATFQEAIAAPNSPFRDWYLFTHWPDVYETFFGVKELPQINLRHPSARQHMLAVVAYWLEFGFDGYRVDYAIGPTPDFWADFRRVTRTVKPDCWTFGEVVEPSDSQIAFEGLMDGCLDFMLLEGLRQTFAFGQWDALRFASFLDRHEAFFPASFSRPSFLDNHDMNRILWALGGDVHRLKLAALCQFTLAGPPIIYYGTEVGLSQERDVRQGSFGLPEEARLPMRWGEEQDPALLTFYQALIALRKQEAALRRGMRVTLSAGDDTLAYSRTHQGETLAAVFNLSQEPRSLEMEGRWTTLVMTTGEAVTLVEKDTCTNVVLPGLTGVVLKP